MNDMLIHKTIQKLKEDNRKISPPLEELIEMKNKIKNNNMRKSKSEQILKSIKNIKYNKTNNEV
jgi:hypothetical protein